jgi:hypothetical protein
LLLPSDGLLLCTARLLLLRLLGPLLLRALSGLSAAILQLVLLLLFPSSLLLLRLLLLRLSGPLWLRLLCGLSGALLPLAVLSALFLLPLWLSLRALLLCGWRSSLPPTLLLFRPALFFVLLVLLRVRGDSPPKKQKQHGGTGSSNELHSNGLR